MATSGTVGQTQITVAQLLDFAALSCGKQPAMLAVEEITAARQALFLLLTSFANQGIQLWTVATQLIGFLPNTASYALQNGSIDVLNCSYRQISLPSAGTATSSAGGTASNAFDQDIDTACTQTAPNGNISYDMGSGNSWQTTQLGIMSAVARTYTLVLESSDDLVTWTTRGSFDAQTYPDRAWVYFQLDGAPNAQAWRVRETGGSTLSLREISLGSNPYDITIGRNNRDEYFNLPNKEFEAQQPSVYWFNRQEPQPVVTLWPVPQNIFTYLLLVQSWTQIQDVGALGNTIAAPQRWMPAIQWGFADWLGSLLTKVDPIKLQTNSGRAREQFILAASEEPDSAPVNFRSRIGSYTRLA